jgi:hypothetical protein
MVRQSSGWNMSVMSNTNKAPDGFKAIAERNVIEVVVPGLLRQEISLER